MWSLVLFGLTGTDGYFFKVVKFDHVGVHVKKIGEKKYSGGFFYANEVWVHYLIVTFCDKDLNTFLWLSAKKDDFSKAVFAYISRAHIRNLQMPGVRGGVWTYGSRNYLMTK